MSKTQVIKAECKECGNADELEVDAGKLGRYMLREALVQQMFPSLSAPERELVMGYRSGYYICNDCWPTVMGDDDTDTEVSSV